MNEKAKTCNQQLIVFEAVQLDTGGVTSKFYRRTRGRSFGEKYLDTRLLLGLARVLVSALFFSSNVATRDHLHHYDWLWESEGISCAMAWNAWLPRVTVVESVHIASIYFIMMLFASALIITTLTMLTTGHADSGRPTLKDDERFRNRMDNFQTQQFI